MLGQVIVVDDIAGAFASHLVELRSRHDRFALALSGGEVARSCYERVARLEPGAIDWSTVEVWWGDERCVELDDPDSNNRLAHEALLDHIGPVAAEHPMVCTGDGGIAYDEQLRAAPSLDLVHLGLGPDGHTASLFPGSEALLAPTSRLVVENVDPIGRNPHPRLTLTYAGIARARRVVVTVAGATKRDAWARVSAGDPTAPATAVDGEHTLWLVERSALGEDASEGGRDHPR